MKEALRDVKISRPENQEEPEMLSVKQLKLFVDLYQFLPSKKGNKAPLLELGMSKRR